MYLLVESAKALLIDTGDVADPNQMPLEKMVMQTANFIAAKFRPARRTRVAEILETLASLGQVREVEGSMCFRSKEIRVFALRENSD